MGKKRMSKSGSSHIEIILSFIIFIGFLAFVLAIFPVYKSEKSEAGIDAVERGILARARMNLSYSSIVLDSETGEDCFSASYPLDENVIVTDSEGVVVDAVMNSGRIYIRSSGTFFYVYSSDEFVENSFDTGSCKALESDPVIGYDFGLVRESEALSYSELEALNSSYYSDYPGLKSEIGIPDNENFGFSVREMNGNYIIRAARDKHARAETLARDVPIQMFYNNGTSVFLMLNIQEW